MAESSQKRVENTVEIEVAHYKQLLLFQQCFQNTCINKGLFGKGLTPPNLIAVSNGEKEEICQYSPRHERQKEGG